MTAFSQQALKHAHECLASGASQPSLDIFQNLTLHLLEVYEHWQQYPLLSKNLSAQKRWEQLQQGDQVFPKALHKPWKQLLATFECTEYSSEQLQECQYAAECLINYTTRQLQQIHESHAPSQYRRLRLFTILPITLILLIGSAGSYWQYHQEQPLVPVETKLQVFWKTPEIPAFSEATQKAWQIQNQGSFQEYVLRFDPPVTVTDLRFDLVNDPVDQIQLKELLIQGESYLPLNGWTWINADWLAEAQTLLPQNHDPYFYHKLPTPVVLSEVHVTMALQRKQSWWKWLQAQP